MQTKAISLIATAQTVMLGFAVLAAATAARCGERFVEGSKYIAYPLVLSAAFTFRDYGWLGIILVAAWTGLALYAQQDPTKEMVTKTLGLGALFIVALTISTILFAWSAIMLFRPF